jgi:hypothetical protein
MNDSITTNEVKIMFFGGSGTNYTQMRADINRAQWRSIVSEAERSARKLKPDYEDYEENIEEMGEFIVSNLETFKNALKEAAEFVKKKTSPGFFFNTEYDYAQKFLSRVNESKNLDQVIEALGYAMENADKLSNNGLIRAIISYSISRCNPEKAELRSLIIKLEGSFYFILVDI